MAKSSRKAPSDAAAAPAGRRSQPTGRVSPRASSAKPQKSTSFRVDIRPAITGLNARWLARKTREAASWLGVRRGALSVRLVSDAEMTRWHRQYMGIDSSTDILTFDHREGAEAGTGNARRKRPRRGVEVDADLVIGLDVARREARSRGHATEREVLLYIVHGLLHCLGYDDRSERGHRIMHRREDEALQAIGVGATFRKATVEAQARGRRPVRPIRSPGGPPRRVGAKGR